MRRRDVAHVCRILANAFQERFSVAAFLFKPELIYEGGIEMSIWPGHKEGEYKAIRFGVSENVENRWPKDVSVNALQEWKDEPKKVFALSPKAKNYDYDGPVPIVTTTLRALYGAPCWTEEEVELIVISFKKAGFGVATPAKLELVKEGSLGNPRESVTARSQPTLSPPSPIPVAVNQGTTPELIAEFDRLFVRYMHSLEFTAGCGSRGQHYVDDAWEELNKFTKSNPQFEKRVPRKHWCDDDGTGGLSSGLVSGAQSCAQQ